MTINRQYPLVHHETVLATGKTYLSFAQPESIVDFSDGSINGVRFHLDIHGTVGTFSSYKVHCKFQIGMPDVDGAGFSQIRWYDLEPEQVKTMILEGVDWYRRPQARTEPYQIINLMSNPSFELDGKGALDIPGTGGEVVGSRPADGGYSGVIRRRTTWTKATTAPSGGVVHAAEPMTVVAGGTYAASIRFAANKTQRLQMGIRWYKGSTTMTTSYAHSALYAATDIRSGHLASHIAVAPDGADSARIVLSAVDGDGASNWLAGDWLDVDAATLVQDNVVPPTFDGDTIGAVWDGTPHASLSRMTIFPNNKNEMNVVASSEDILPVTKSRSIKGFGMLVRLHVQPVFIGGSADAGIIYSLVATH